MSTTRSLTAPCIQAIAVGILAGLLFYAVTLRHPDLFALDYTFHWRAARALIDGQDPYQVVRPSGPYPFQVGYYYPLPGAFLSLPVAWLPAQVAGAVLVAVGASLFALAILRESPGRWPLLLSAPMVSAAVTGQFTAPLLAAAFIWPVVQLMGVAKPNLGLALYAARPTRWFWIGAIPLLMVAFALVPRWPWEWLSVLRNDPAAHLAPVLVPGGIVLLLAAVRWRQPEARLLLVMALVPQTMTWYDPLPVLLVARTVRESLVLALITQLGFVASLYYEQLLPPDMRLVFGANAQFALWFLYVPALGIVLRRRGALSQTSD